MGTTDCLKDSIQHTHDGLSERLDAARAVTARPEQTRRGCPPIDLFCSGASQHLHAVDEVLMPRVRATEGYRIASHELAVVLAHVKAHEFGSTYETGYAWPRVWTEVEEVMASLRAEEERLVQRLTEMLADDELVTMTERLEHAQVREPTRPHPYLPHAGLPGRMARRAMRMADAFWDTVEGRYVPEREHVAKKKPGLLGQYFLADPRFGEDEEDLDDVER